MAAVTLANVTKTFGNGVEAVRNLSLDVADGELLVLVGPSGCGKTTTLRLIAGLESPTGGTVRIAGRVVNDLPPRSRDVALVFQRPALYPHLSVRDNLSFSLRLRGRGWFRPGLSSADKDRVLQTAKLLGLESVLGRR